MAFTNRDVETTLRTIFRRCVVCPETAPSCPNCLSGTLCSQIAGSCDQCARTQCVSTSLIPGSVQDAPKKSSTVGVTAGGVVGGVVGLSMISLLIWLCMRRRRKQDKEPDWQPVELPVEKPNDFAMRRDARSSTHTVASMASSVLTRASNIIQIAYIPGVTNRSGPGSPGFLVPPVPPIPIPSAPSSAPGSPYSMEDQHFFVPGDLRDSTYSGLSDGRSSYARTSIAPSLARSSMATTIYRNNAIVSPLPAQTIVRGKAAVVSVKSSQTNSPAETPALETPPVPTIDYGRHAQPIKVQMPRQTDGVHHKPHKSVTSTTTVGKPVPLNITKKGTATLVSKSSQSTIGSQKSEGPIIRPLTEVSVTDSEATHSRARKSVLQPDVDSLNSNDSDSDGDDHARFRRSLLETASDTRDSQITEIQDTPGILQSPFANSSQAYSPHIPQRNPSRTSAKLTTVMEEASKRSSTSGSGSKERDRSPFSDDNAIGN